MEEFGMPGCGVEVGGDVGDCYFCAGKDGLVGVYLVSECFGVELVFCVWSAGVVETLVYIVST